MKHEGWSTHPSSDSTNSGCLHDADGMLRIFFPKANDWFDACLAEDPSLRFAPHWHPSDQYLYSPRHVGRQTVSVPSDIRRKSLCVSCSVLENVGKVLFFLSFFQTFSSDRLFSVPKHSCFSFQLFE